MTDIITKLKSMAEDAAAERDKDKAAKINEAIKIVQEAMLDD